MLLFFCAQFNFQTIKFCGEKPFSNWKLILREYLAFCVNNLVADRFEWAISRKLYRILWWIFAILGSVCTTVFLPVYVSLSVSVCHFNTFFHNCHTFYSSYAMYKILFAGLNSIGLCLCGIEFPDYNPCSMCIILSMILFDLIIWIKVHHTQ